MIKLLFVGEQSAPTAGAEEGRGRRAAAGLLAALAAVFLLASAASAFAQAHPAAPPEARGGAGETRTRVLAAPFFAVSLFFVHRSFYGMRINAEALEDTRPMGDDRETARANTA